MSASSPSRTPQEASIAIAVQEDQISRLLALALRLENYQPHILTRDVSVLDTLLREPYAVAIVDAHLTPMDGVTIYERVRDRVSTPVILMMMRDDVRERTRAEQVGAGPILFMPFTMKELFSCVEAVELDATRATPPIAGAAHAGPTIAHVLLAIASPALRAAMRAVLVKAGYNVTVASNGVEAADLLLLHPEPLIVILDSWLPELSGHALLLQLGSDPQLMERHVFALILNQSQPAARLDAELTRLIATYAIPVLKKPVGYEQLLTLVHGLRARLASSGQQDATEAGPS